MKKFLITAIAIAAMGSAVAQSAPDKSKITRAIETTQLLTASICGERGNLDPKTITAESNAFAFILALVENSSPEKLQANAAALSAQMKSFHCSSSGILQLA